MTLEDDGNFRAGYAMMRRMGVGAKARMAWAFF
jgi:hypothetical protein